MATAASRSVGSMAPGGGVASGGAAAAAISASSRCRNSRLSQRSTRGYGRTLEQRSQMNTRPVLGGEYRAVAFRPPDRAGPAPAGAPPAMPADPQSRTDV